ncbi:Gustatory receptor 9 [Hyalella azteca]|uniref:Gustatory receptor 9 n=1 Tax=Hyalella azteca TaxID=294128 RepID=A0A6A0GTU4_HYAAZ|nr:Gustatory receptor 9 [Hyalella azteca]
MLLHSKVVAYFYFLLRLFGFFPFTWKPEIVNKINERKWKVKTNVEKSTAWEVWSFFIMVFTVTAMGVDIHYAMVNPRGAVLGFNTLVVAHMIYDIVTAVSTALLQIILWKQRMQVAHFIKFSDVMDVKIRFTNSSTILMALLVVIGLPLNCYLMITALRVDTNVVSLATMSIKIVWSSSLMLFIGIIYHNSMQFIGLQLEALFEPIKESYETSDGLQSYTSVVAGRRNKITKWPVITKKSNDVKTVSALVNQVTVADAEEEGPIIWDGTETENLRESILQLFHLNNMINIYSDSPMTVTMTNLIIWLLTSVFYVTLWKTLDISLRLLAILNLILTLAPLGYILNSTDCLRQQLKNLHWILTFLMNHRTHKDVHHKLEQLRSLLEQCPGFSVMGIFTMSRARSVDIFSFVATYIVILLQFSFTENRKSPSASSAPGVAG